PPASTCVPARRSSDLLVQAKNKGGAKEKAHGGRYHLDKALPPAHGYGRGEQAPETGRHHDPPCKAQHAVHDRPVWTFEKEDKGRAKGRERPGEQGGIKSGQHRVQLLKIVDQWF